MHKLRSFAISVAMTALLFAHVVVLTVGTVAILFALYEARQVYEGLR